MGDDERRDAVIAFLSRPGKISRAIRRVQQQIEDTRQSLTSISVNYSGMPGGGGGPKSQVEEGVVAIVAMEEKVRRLEAERDVAVKEVMAKISLLKNTDHKAVLASLFVFELSWDEAVERLEMSRWTVSKLRNEALREMEGVLCKEKSV